MYACTRANAKEKGKKSEREAELGLSGGTSFGGPILFFNTALPHRRYAPGVLAYARAICIDP